MAETPPPNPYHPKTLGILVGWDEVSCEPVIAHVSFSVPLQRAFLPRLGNQLIQMGKLAGESTIVEEADGQAQDH